MVTVLVRASRSQPEGRAGEGRRPGAFDPSEAEFVWDRGLREAYFALVVTTLTRAAASTAFRLELCRLELRT